MSVHTANKRGVSSEDEGKREGNPGSWLKKRGDPSTSAAKRGPPSEKKNEGKICY